MADKMRLATDERRDLADLLDTLTPAQWAHPSLCEGWTVRDVVAHLISYEELGYLGMAATLIRAGFRPGHMNRIRFRVYQDHQPDQLVGILRSHFRPRGFTAGFGGGIALTDCLIHQQDIRRPLGLPRDVPPDRLVEALNFSLRAPVLPSKQNAAGILSVATDIDWRHGDGPEIRGTGESLIMALAGRADALDELDGPGTAALTPRISAVP
jgi:uncharacterized protein (TIGR03083 family)